MLVELPEHQGIGKLLSANQGRCLVSVFHSVFRSEQIEMPLEQLRRGFLSRQTRVYVQQDDRFSMGRVTKYFRQPDGLIEYEVRFPNGRLADLSEVQLHVRPWNAPDDPAENLASGGAESQFLHDRRQAAIGPLSALRNAAQGMSALISAGIEFVPHQIAAVRRILADPIQRYLLADEVGLGKTIEAGLVIRQHLIDDPDTTVLIAVPRHLRGQWETELRTKLRLDQFDKAFDICTHEDLETVEAAPDVLVVDEAHHLVGMGNGPLLGSATNLVDLAKASKVLLLLSATPALSDDTRFLALLNLLDPISHPLEDIVSFRTKLGQRREFGRLLLSLDPEGSSLVLRQRSAEALKLFPKDPIVGDLAPRLIEASRSGGAQLPSICNALKVHIADTYRIHQRLIRSRRADASGWEFMPRGPLVDGKADFGHVREEVDTDVRVEDLLAGLEDWRYSALASCEPSDSGRLSKLAARYVALIEALGVDASTFTAVLTAGELLFDGEDEIKEALLAIAASEDASDTRVRIMAESTERLLRTLLAKTSHPKIVAFSSSTELAGDFHRALESRLIEASVLLLTGSLTEDASAGDAMSAFSKSKRPAVLVVDRHGEEGLNLNFADAIVHLDLPFSAARVEQRIGRLDRFGRRQSVIRHRIMLPSDDDSSPWLAWLNLLTEGFLIFNRSISDVQFLLDQIEGDVAIALLRDGPSAASATAGEIRVRFANERLSQDEQSALDRIALAEEPVGRFIEGLDAVEENEDALEGGIEKWLVGVLQLARRASSRSERDPFRFETTSNTLVPPVPWLATFDVDTSKPLTWRRRIAALNSDVTLLRPGTPLIDAIERYMRWDDRGTAFATWRVDPGWQEEPWLAFRLCFVVEADIRLSDLLAPTFEERAMIRRSQQYLPSFLSTLHVDSDGSPITSSAALSILQRPYNASDRDSAWLDINLGSRAAVLADFIDAASFEQCCRRARDVAHSSIVIDPSFQERVRAAEASARADLERRQARYLRRWADGDSLARKDLATSEAVLASIVNPKVRLDAIGCFILSNHRPQEIGDARS